MKARFFVPLGGAALLVFTAGLHAHGGMYRGPQDTTPPSPGIPGRPGTGAGPNTPQPGHPGMPGQPNTPSPTTPRSGTGPTAGQPSGPPGRTTPGMPIDVGPDLSTWDYWWEFNKDSYLNLKDAVHRGGIATGTDEPWLGVGTMRREEALRPTHEQLRNEVLPALYRAIEATEDRDIATSCMVAMAKIGEDHPDFRLIDVFKKRLSRGDQEVRETAALAIGIAARNDGGELALLTSLARDDAEARRTCGREVDARTRSFAIYAIGLLARERSQLAIKREALTVLQQVLTDDAASNANLQVAAITSIGLLDIGSADAADRSLRDEAVASLETYYERSLGVGRQLIQAHCPTAIARLIGRSSASARCKQRFADELLQKDRSRRSADLDRSCALALGQLCEPYDDDKSPDAAYSKLLAQVRVDHRDPQTRYFATIALGQIGGAKNRELLLKALDKARALDKPWCALALGVMARARLVAQQRTGGDAVEDRGIGDALALQLVEGAEPGLTGALGVALGLCRHVDSAPEMRDRMLAEKHKEAQAGYLCLGLALMDDRASIDALHKVIPQAKRRPELLEKAATALGLLGDKNASTVLRGILVDEQSNLATIAAVARAVGLIGDRRSIEPLKTLLADSNRSDLQRAFAAVALGGIADRAPLPWYAKIAAGVNYRASVETLTNQATGVLDIL